MTNLNLYDWSQTIGWTLFHSLWQATIIGGIIWLIFKLISKDNARVRYALSGIGLVLICIASAITFYRYIPKETNAAVADLGQQILLTDFGQLEESFFSQLWIQISSQIEYSFPILVNIWIIGMLFLSINLIIKYINTQKLKKHLTFPLRSEYKEIADRIINKYQLKQKVIFKESGFLEIPSVIGYFKPIVLLPVSILSGIPENQLEIIIAHELAHIRRHDYLLQFIQGIIELVFFYHPVVWWLSSVVNAEREHICDDLAVKICGESLTLIKALNNMEAIRKKQYEMVLGFSGKKGKVLGRIKRILRPKVTISPRRERFMLSGVFTLLFVGLFLISNFAISGNTNIQKTFSKINVLDQKNLQEAISPEANSTITEQDKKKKKNQKKNDELQVQELELVKEVDAVKETKLETSVTAMSVSPIDSHDFEFPKDSVKSEKWVKIKADEIIREQMEEMKSAAKEMQEMKLDFDVDKMKKELKESLKHLDFNSEEFQNEMKEQESEIEVQLKELSDENYLKEFEKERELQKKELENHLKEIEESSELNMKEKENIKARLKESVERMNSTEFQNKLKKQLEKAKESLEKHEAEFKSGEFENRLKEQRENIQQQLKKMESPEFQEKLNRQIKESKTRIQEHIKRVNSEEYRKELEEFIKKNPKRSFKYDSPELVTRVFHQDSTTQMSNVKVGYPMPKSTVRTGYRIAPSFSKIATKTGQPLIILDGKEISREAMDQISPNEIAKIDVLKDATATALYGTVDGANGVILITSKSGANKLKADSVVVIGYGKSKGNVRTGYKGPMRIKSSSLSEDPKKQPLIIIDGKKISNEAMENIPPESIESISVLKDASAINKYGKEGANGVVLITSKARNKKSQSSVRMKFGSDKNSPLFIVDGKKISSKKAEKIDPNKIESIDVLKGENATEQYGKKAKNGVVLIRLKSENGVGKSNNDEVFNESEGNPIFIVDGKKVSKNIFEDVDSDDIQNFTLFTEKDAIERYGKDGKDGVYIIESKK